MDAKYHLMPRAHNFELTAKNNSITECDFITRCFLKTFIDFVLFIAILYIYIPLYMYRFLFTVILSLLASCN